METGPSEIHLREPETAGHRTPRYFAKATATAAIVPVCTTRNRVQPKRNPASGP